MDTSVVATFRGKKILSFKPKVTKLWLSGIIHSMRILNAISEIVKLASVAPNNSEQLLPGLGPCVLVFSLKAAPESR